MSEPRDPGPAPEPILRPRWKSALERIHSQSRSSDPNEDPIRAALSAGRLGRVYFVLNVRESRLRDELVIDFCTGPNEGTLSPLELDEDSLRKLEPAEDRGLLRLLIGNAAEDRQRARVERDGRWSRTVVRPGLYALLLEPLAASGRFLLEAGLPDVEVSGPLGFRAEPYGFELAIEAEPGGAGFTLFGRITGAREPIQLEAPALFLASGLFLAGRTLAICDAGDARDLAYRLRRSGPVSVPAEAKDELLVQLATLPGLPEIALPPELHWSQALASPRPRVAFKSEDEAGEGRRVMARVSFDYGGHEVSASDRGRVVLDQVGRQLFRRDRAAERVYIQRLGELGCTPASAEERSRGELGLLPKALLPAIRSLVEEGWAIEADGAPLRSPGALLSKVSSGIDWFDLAGGVDFDGVELGLPELLAAARAGRPFVDLPDGSRGLLPDWIERWERWASTGRVENGRLRFAPCQAGILDALLTGQGESAVDVKFERLRRSFQKGGAGAVSEPPGFLGKLRDYQKQGLAWLYQLEANGWSGCLADDMGLGKTVQVLAFLQRRHRGGGERPGPSLIVVPPSLVPNWRAEAARFVPELSLCEYIGKKRLEARAHLHEHDLILTTYGTLRQDILDLVELRFCSVILDEAQAIKNPRSQAAKACRLLQADLRLAMSGTPIENGLSELWSLFEFLNPGMLGPLEHFAAPGRSQDEAWLASLSRALEPLLLRRSKEQVLKELPPKTEQTILVELDETERARYDELRDHYRVSLSTRLAEMGIDGARIHVLEALLRLRQAACHPGLIDPARVEEPSAKVDLLVDQLAEVSESGHKALVFSQFTSLLQIVKRRLEARGIQHEYLDGSTRDRQAPVERFQSDPKTHVFLISLKAGGTGLNLTASDYVFVLDPWWNPAVEAQAIDRAHRMGQTRPVFAYRLIAKDTVEEKIQALQAEKQKLADAIISGDRGGLKSLSPSELLELFN